MTLTRAKLNMADNCNISIMSAQQSELTAGAGIPNQVISFNILSVDVQPIDVLLVIAVLQEVEGHALPDAWRHA